MKTTKNFIPPSNLLIVGLGGIGQRHIAAIRKLYPECLVSALRSGRTSYPLKFPPDKTFNNIDNIDISGLDGAIISNPSPMHIETALKILENEIPTFIEKPLTDKSSRVRNASELLRRNKSKILVGYVLRYLPQLEAIQDIITKGHLGLPIKAEFRYTSWLPHWRPGRDFRNTASAQKILGGGVLRELSHEINLAHTLFGLPQTLRGRTIQKRTLGLDVEEAVLIVMSTKTISHLRIYLDFSCDKRKRVFSLTLQNGTVEWDLETGVLRLFDFRVNDQKIIRFTSVDPFVKQMEHFNRVMQGEAYPLIDVCDGLTTVKIIEAIENSSNRRTTLTSM